MSNERRFEGASIAEQAALWWCLLNHEEVHQSDHQDFGRWVARSPERVEAYLRMAQLMQSLKSSGIQWPDTPADVLVKEACGSPDKISLIDTRVATDNPRATSSSETFLSRRLTAAALLVLVLVLGALWWGGARPQRFQTERGEQRSILLVDGSRVTLNTATTMEVEWRRDRRIVRLLDGEALFVVAHDASRPFDVLVRQAVVRAVGTEFNVKLRRDRTEVTVVEGHVDVAPLEASAQSAPPTDHLSRSPARLDAQRNSSAEVRLLGAMERVEISASGVSLPTRLQNVAATTAWTERKLIFDHAPLAEVADEFNRYSNRRILIEGPALQRRNVTGVFQTDDASSFLTFLSGTPGVKLVEAGSTIWVTEPGP